jgi:hypothetical protein
MFKRFRCENRKPVWSRFVSCAAIGLYVFALVVMPAVDVYNHGCRAEVNGEQSNSEKDCPICEFARLVVPFFVVADPFVLQTDTGVEICFTISIPSVVSATALPPCRAPPVV